jgi:hypothetical protein
MTLSKIEAELIKTIFVVGCITILMLFNILFFKADGVLLNLVIGGLFGLLGYQIGKIKISDSDEEDEEEDKFKTLF